MAFILVLVLGLAGLGLGLFEFLSPTSGTAGTAGAALVSVSTALLVVAAALLAFVTLKRWLFGLLLTLSIIDAAATALRHAHYFASFGSEELLDSLDFANYCVSLKDSDPQKVIDVNKRFAERRPDVPLHLGVTEAGDGEDGRIKSAIGIGSLLCDGLGDTIRVSLTEDSPNEIAVCNDLLAQIPELTDPVAEVPDVPLAYDPFDYARRSTPEIELTDGDSILILPSQAGG